jgi:hypothetical protein
MKNSVDLGELQQLALLAVARLGKNACGSAIQDELSRTSGRDVSVATAFLTLVRLENQGLVRLGGVKKGPEGGDMGRRTVEITSVGWEALGASRVPPASTGEREEPE